MRVYRRRLSSGASICGAACLLAGLTVGRAPSPDAAEVASLSLTCSPAEQGVRCRVLALFRDVSRSPSDVTTEALWNLTGIPGAHILPDGSVDASTDGDLLIEARYCQRRARVAIRLIRNQPGQILVTVRGSVYVEIGGRLCPVPGARVEVVGGSSAGISTTARDDGSYELRGVVAGEVTIRASKIGFASGEGSGQLAAGENHLNVLIDVLPSTALTAL